MKKAVATKRKKPVRTKAPDPLLGVPRLVDIHVGGRLRQRRTLLGISQEKLGDAVGLTFQQIQKYERGANRIGASRIYEFSQVLDIPVSYFFEDMNDLTKSTRGRRVDPDGIAEEEKDELTTDPLARRETLELVRAYYKITQPKVRKRIFELTKTLANVSNSK